jgi:hypothetical protein
MVVPCNMTRGRYGDDVVGVHTWPIADREGTEMAHGRIIG